MSGTFKNKCPSRSAVGQTAYPLVQINLHDMEAIFGKFIVRRVFVYLVSRFIVNHDPYSDLMYVVNCHLFTHREVVPVFTRD